MILAWLFWLTLSPEATAVDQPLRLVAEKNGSRVALAVVGEAPTACEVSYELQVDNGPTGKSNRSVQRGTAHLLPHRPIVLARVSIGGPHSGAWQASLNVTSCDGKRYQLNASEAG